MTTFKDVLKNPMSYVVFSGGVNEPTTELISAVAAEASAQALSAGISDIAGLKALELELWAQLSARLTDPEYKTNC